MAILHNQMVKMIIHQPSPRSHAFAGRPSVLAARCRRPGAGHARGKPGDLGPALRGQSGGSTAQRHSGCRSPVLGSSVWIFWAIKMIKPQNFGIQFSKG